MQQDHRLVTLARGLEADPVPVQLDLLVLAELLARLSARSPVFYRGLAYLICMPEIALLITSRWISEVPSKIVQILASRCIRSTGNSRE